MKEQFIEKRFHKASLERIENINSILTDFQEQGFVVSIRQVYYKLVSTGKIPNNQKEYDKISNLITDARRAGLIDWDLIEDRTRFLRGWNTYDNPGDAIRSVSYRYNIDLWQGQDCYVEVWTEKDAMIDVVGHACRKYRIDHFSCRGYCSDDAMYKAAKRMERRYRNGKQIVVLYLGDHDPSGLDMSRDIPSRLGLMSGLSGKIDFQRIALNMDQIEELNPPPNPAKETDKRAQAYIDKFGSYSWELDALEPSYITDLIHTNIEKYLDMEKFEKRKEQEEKDRELIIDLADQYSA